jgi:Effector Associated Constant Component 1
VLEQSDDYVTISIEGPGADYASLRASLVAEDELRGQVRTLNAAPAPGTLGIPPEALVVALGQGGAATVLASALVTWLRRRTNEVTIRIIRKDGSRTEVHAKQARGAVSLQGLVDEISENMASNSEK